MENALAKKGPGPSAQVLFLFAHGAHAAGTKGHPLFPAGALHGHPVQVRLNLLGRASRNVHAIVGHLVPKYRCLSAYFAAHGFSLSF